MNKENYIGIATEELYRIFEILNKNYFNNDLPVPMITIQKMSRSNTAGWFVPGKIWKPQDSETEPKYEINICAETLKADTLFIVETLQHELVHYCNTISETKDVNGQKHNKKFKALAEKVGLICNKSEKTGWGDTAPSDELASFIRNKISPTQESFKYFRENILEEKTKKERVKKQFKYACPECKTEAKAKKDINIMCGDCNKKFEIIDEEE